MLFKNLKIEEFKEFHPEFDEDVLLILNLLMSLNQEIARWLSFVQVAEVKNWKIVTLNLNYFSTTRVCFEVE